MNALAMWTPAFIIGYLLTLAVSITGSVMVGLAVYNDGSCISASGISRWNGFMRATAAAGAIL